LKEFIGGAESEVASLTNLYSVVVICLTILLVHYVPIWRNIKIV